MITDKETNTIYFSEKLIEQFLEISTQMCSTLDSLGAKPRFLRYTKDIWARDYMPIQVNEPKFIQYTFYPDYLQKLEDIKSDPESICSDLKLNTVKSDIILDGGNVQNARMIERLADQFLPLEAIVETGIAFELHQRHFNGDCLSGIQIESLKNRRHTASIEHVDDLEPFIQNLADFQLIALRNFRHLAIIGNPHVIEDPLDAFDLRYLNGEIVICLSFLRERNQL